MKRFFALLLAFAMILTFAACEDTETTSRRPDRSNHSDDSGKQHLSSDSTFKIGMSGPLTGGAAIYGISVKNSAQMAIDEINAAGGLNGYKFELVATDDQHDASKVQTNFDTMMDEGVVVQSPLSR